MSSSDPCQISPDWAWDSSYCWSLGTNSRVWYIYKTYLRYFDLATQQQSIEIPILSYSDTNFDRCLPGPATCTAYTGSGCPRGHVAKLISDSPPSKLEICCPSASALSRELLKTSYMSVGTFSKPTITYTESQSSTMTICAYNWGYGWDPTSTYSVLPSNSDRGWGHQNQLWIRAFTVISSTKDSTALSSSSTTPFSTSSLVANTATNISVAVAPSAGNNERNGRIGIGVGVSLGLLFLGFAIATVLLLLRRHRSKRMRLEQQDEGPVEKPELPGEGMLKDEIAKEVVGTQLYEMADTSAPVELESTRGSIEKSQQEITEHLAAKETSGTAEEQKNPRTNEPKDTKVDEIKAI